MPSRFKEYLRSLPVRIVVAGAVLGIALATRHYWDDEKEQAAPGPTDYSLDSLYPEGNEAAMKARALREQSLPPAK